MVPGLKLYFLLVAMLSEPVERPSRGWGSVDTRSTSTTSISSTVTTIAATVCTSTCTTSISTTTTTIIVAIITTFFYATEDAREG